jgi:uncharacterized protein (DUF169 family)
MNSKIAEAIGLELEPVVLLWADEKPEGAMEFRSGKWGCIMFLMAAAAAKGKVAAASRETFGCWGGGVGMGFGNQYEAFPGGEECFCRFLSSGNSGTEPGQAIGEGMAASEAAAMADDFLVGERYKKTPELVEKFVAGLPIMDIPARYVVMKPLREVDLANDQARSITFFVNPDQFSENEREHPRAVVGMTDLSARKNVRRQFGKDVLSVSVTPTMLQRMEENVEGSFLQRETWKSLLE